MSLKSTIKGRLKRLKEPTLKSSEEKFINKSIKMVIEKVRNFDWVLDKKLKRKRK